MRHATSYIRYGLIALLAVPAAEAQTVPTSVKVTWVPARPKRESIFRVAVRPGDTGETLDSLRSVHAVLADEPLHFAPDGDGAFRALGAISSPESDSLPLPIVVDRASGRQDTTVVWISIAPPDSVASRTASSSPDPLRVAPRFAEPADSTLSERIEREAQMARDVSRRAHGTPRLWRGTFVRPRSSRITSRFGHTREFNGVVQSRHMGVDFRGAPGAPVRVTNRGVVVLVADFYFGGNVVYVDHGAGLVSAYFHLNTTSVAVGDTVAKSQVIGGVGATGRVTGAHLHWVARYGGITVDPVSLLALPPVPTAAARESKPAPTVEPPR